MFTKRSNAYRVYLLLEAVASFAFSLAFTVTLIYHVRSVGLNPLQLVLVGTMLEGTILLLEVPTGIVADLYSRRLSVVLGFALIGGGMILEGSIPRFESLLLAMVIAGVGYTFISGATQAWLVDEIGQQRAGDAFLRGSQVGQIAAIIGIPFSVLIGSAVLYLPIQLAGTLLMGLAIVLLLVMSEEGFTPVPREERATLRSMFETFGKGMRLVRGRPVLLTLLIVGVLHGGFSEGFDRLWTAHILENFSLPALGQFDEIVWFGIIRIVSMILGIGLMEIFRRRIDFSNPKAIGRSLLFIYSTITITLVIFALAGSFWLVLGAYWLVAAFRKTSDPIFTTWLNQNIDSNVRATVISIYGQADAIGQIGVGPGVGMVGTVFSLRAALAVSALFLLPTLPLFGRSANQQIKAAVETAS